MKSKFLLFTTAFLLSGMAWGQIIHVPGDQPTIQDGINAATDGDTVLVAENTYYENIRFMGKAITVTSEHILDGDSSHIVNTIIDGSQPTDSDSAATVMFVNGEDTTSILNGFTITGGSGVMFMTYVVRAGGGIFSYNAGCKIINNIITENDVEDSDKAGAAGIGCVQDQGGHWVIIRDNYIGYNTAMAGGFTAFGGGMAIMTSCYIENNMIEFNTCTNTGGAADGGGIELEAFVGTNPIAYVNSNIIRNNELNATTIAMGGGLYCYYFHEPEITDNLFDNNTINSLERCYGGAIYAGVADNGIIRNNIIENNTANGDLRVRGGGIWLKSSNSFLISNNSIEYNSLNGNKALGAGIYSWLNNNLNIYENSICNNISNSDSCWGGAMFSTVSGKLVFQNNNISNNYMNSTVFWFGAGIAIQNMNDNTYILENQFYNNNGTEVSNWSLGGAIFIWSVGGDSAVIVERNMIKNHGAERGGGIWAANAFNFYLANNILMNNNASLYGGGVCFEEYDEKDNIHLSPPSKFIVKRNNRERENDYHPVIVNNTFLYNSAEWGGAIDANYDYETPVIFNSIFWGNEADTIPDISNYTDQKMLVSYCNVDTSQIYDPWAGEGNILCDPELRSDSVHLDWPSLCVNAGIESLTFWDTTYYCPDQDFDGQDRPFDGTLPDIGADEAQWLYVSKFEHALSNNMLLSVYPNPFSEATTIKFELLNAGHVKLDVYNSTGEQVETIASESMLKGLHQFEWDASQLPAGIYFLKLNNGGQTVTEKLIKMK